MTRAEQEKLFSENVNLVYYVLYKKFPQYARDEDFQQIASIALWRACVAFDPIKGKFSTIAIKAITNAILNFIQRELPKYSSGISLDAQLANTDTDTSLGELLCDESQEISADNISLNKVVSDYIKMQTSHQTQNIIKLLIDGYSQSEIGKKLGTSRTYVNTVVKEMRKELSIMLGAYPE